MVVGRKQLFLFLGSVLVLSALAGGAFFWFQARQESLEQTVAIKQGQKIIEQEGVTDQFPLTKENGRYHFLCISGDVVTQQPTVKLPTGQEISHTLPCSYHDINGQQRTIHLPLYTYKLEEKTVKKLGYKVKHDVSERLILNSKKGFTERWAGTMGWLERAGWTGPGHIFYIIFAQPTTPDDFINLSSGSYFNQALKQLMTTQEVEQFIKTGDASVLPETTSGEAIILPMHVGFNNRFADMQEKQSE